MKVFILLFLGFLSAFSTDWEHNTTFPQSGIKTLYAVDSNNCYVLTDRSLGPAIYKSTNQGRTWDLLYTYEFWTDGTPILINAHTMSVKDTNIIYIAYGDATATIKKSTDGGKTFNRIKISDTTSSYIYLLEMYNDKIGIARTHSEVYITRDGWITNEVLNVPTLNIALQSKFIDSSNFVYIVYCQLSTPNATSCIYKYNIDTKENKLLYTFPKENSLGYYDKFEYINDSLSFISSSNSLGIGATRSDIIYRSKGSLSNWEKILDQENAPKFGFNDIAFYDEFNGVAVAEGGKIYMTNDGGDNWEMERPTEIFVGYDINYGPDVNRILWAGRTPMFGSSRGNLYRYEGNFFKFDQTRTIEKPTIASANCDVKDVPSFIKLSWNKLQGADFYNVEISESNNFSGINRVYKDIEPNFKLEYGLGSGMKYYWRVLGFNKYAASPWSNACSFTTKLFNLTGLLPKCNDTIYKNEITLNWQKVQNADKYVVEYSYSKDFSSTLKLDTVTLNNLTISNMKMDTTFFWRAKAINTISESDWSTTCNFSTKTLNSIPSELETMFAIYPNPASDVLYLGNKSNIGIRKIELISLLGTTLIELNEAEITQTTKLDTRTLVTCRYLLKLTDSKGRTVVQQVGVLR